MNTNQEIENQKQYMEKVKNIIKDKKLKYTILTMGCQLNENDSEKICGMLEQMGYTKTENQKRETHTVIRKIIIPTLYQTVAPYMHSNPSLQTFLYRKEKR